MIGVTALLSSLVGLAGGLAPDILKFFRDGQGHNHELALLEAQSKHQLAAIKAGAGAKLDEAQIELFTEEARATRETMVQAMQAHSAPTGSAWIDGFNALLRPACATMIIALFAFVALGFSTVISAEIFAPVFLTMVEAVMGYLFGYRSGRKLPASQTGEGGWRTWVMAD